MIVSKLKNAESMKMSTPQMPIYMDHNATTPVDPRVRQAMEPFLSEAFGNASSNNHAFGWQAQTAVRKAREQVATLLGCMPTQVIWTSGATESNNLALLGLSRALRSERPHFITQATEHKAVLEVLEAAKEWDADVTILSVDSEGLVRLEDIERAITPRTVLLSIMMANNEVGTVQPIAAIGELCRARNLILHTDAAQSVGKCAIDLKTLAIDMLSLSGHKIYGPKGVGALILRPRNRDFELKPILFGGEQEKKLRPGTLNIPGIVGLGEACAIAGANFKEENQRLHGWQLQILNEVFARFPHVKLNGPHPKEARGMRLCNNLNLSFPELMPDDLALELSGIAYSSGSACNSANASPSHVLKAMGLPDSLARSTLRLGLGRFTTSEEVRLVTDKLLKMLEKSYASRAH